jgi:hypothetical protein
MRRAVLFALSTAILLAAGSVANADHNTSAELRGHLESATALLDSHTRRLYYEIRSRAEDDEDQTQLLADARELWRAARRTNDQALDGAAASRLEPEIRELEDTFHAVEYQYQQLRRQRVEVAPVSKRLQRIDNLVHSAHDRVHDLMDQEKSVQGNAVTPQRPTTSRTVTPQYRTVEPPPRVQDAGRRAADYVEPPAIRVGPDGFYFDGRRFTIPLGR